ncbi:MAG: hypothetical protein JXK08_04025 [Flavobacteriaceae bacterium]|nr:hypothetical protein [Flavobacteriaceae bacterium]
MHKIKERQKLSWEGMFYSIQRIDLLIITICGGGVYVCLETIKYLSDKQMEINILIKISGSLFILGIIINFLSQIFGYKANKQDYLMCQTQIDAGDKINKKEKSLIDYYDRSSESFSKLTDRFNYISMGLMFLALIITMLYFLFIY